MENTPRLVTKRLVLDRLTMADVSQVARWLSSDAVCRGLLLLPHRSPEEYAEMIRRVVEQYDTAEDYFQWAIRENGVCIGRMSLVVNRRHQSGMMAYSLAESAWGKGYMTAALTRVIDFAFDELGLNRIEGDHFVENPASGRVMEKSGMKKEGYARQKYCKEGVFHDAVLYAVLKSDRT